MSGWPSGRGNLGVNWEAIGAIGEMVGAAAVILTLGYIAVQIRQNRRQIEENTESVRAASRDETLRAFSHYREHIIRDPDTADLYLRGLRNLDDLDARDRLRFTPLISELFFTFQSVYLRAMELRDPEPWQWLTQSLRQFLRQPAIREWWSGANWQFVEKFVAEIERNLPANVEESNREHRESAL